MNGPDGQFAVHAPINYAYILAASHSGSTLLAMLLNAHPGVTTVGEFAAGGCRERNGYLCSCGQPIGECSFWRNVETAMHRRGADFDVCGFGMRLEKDCPRWVRRLLRLEHRGRTVEMIRDRLLDLSPAWRSRFAEVMRQSELLARVILRMTGATILVDSSKLAHRLKYMLRMPCFRTKVIHLVRDGRAVALSYMDQDQYADATDPAMRRGGRGLTAPITAPKMPMRRAADEWLRCIRSAEHALAHVSSSDWMRVRYENLCRRPAETLAEVFTFLGVDPALAKLDFRKVEHHVLGNGMRLDKSATIFLDERWQKILHAVDLKMFDHIAGRMNRRYGYE